MAHRILITGASGQFGTYLVRALDRKPSLIAWSGETTGELFGVPLQPVDLRHHDRVTTAFREARPSIVIHTAAMATVADCYRDPGGAASVNAAGTALLAERAVE